MIETKGQRKAANILVDTIQTGSVETVFCFNVVYVIRASCNNLTYKLHTPTLAQHCIHKTLYKVKTAVVVVDMSTEQGEIGR